MATTRRCCGRYTHVPGSDGVCLRCDAPIPPERPSRYDPLDDPGSLESWQLERDLRERPGTHVGTWAGEELLPTGDDVAGWGDDGDPWQGGGAG